MLLNQTKYHLSHQFVLQLELNGNIVRIGLVSTVLAFGLHYGMAYSLDLLFKAVQNENKQPGHYVSKLVTSCQLQYKDICIFQIILQNSL